MDLNLRVLRAIKNINQSELARRSGVATSIIRTVEKNDGNYTIVTLTKLLDVLGYELCVREKKGE